jgi:hypothetical protein
MKKFVLQSKYNFVFILLPFRLSISHSAQFSTGDKRLKCFDQLLLHYKTHVSPFYRMKNIFISEDKMPYLGPNTVFRLRNVVKKSDHYFGAPFIKKVHQRVAERGM